MSVAGDSRGGRTLSKLEAISSLIKTQLYFRASYHLLDHSISTHYSVFKLIYHFTDQRRWQWWWCDSPILWSLEVVLLFPFYYLALYYLGSAELMISAMTLLPFLFFLRFLASLAELISEMWFRVSKYEWNITQVDRCTHMKMEF